ncbi:MAG TPA: chemotaxis protein CheX [Edaphobacter sp.]|nr:chemotaxis protein CheX [Edaphobacter sp.]
MLDTADIANFIRCASAEVFSTMLGLELEPGQTREDAAGPDVADGVLSFIGLAGPWAGAGAISCSAGLACKLCAALLMTEAPAVNEDVLDAMGEVTNMIVGNFKTLAEERLGPLGLSIPTVIYGRNFKSRGAGRHSWVVVPFQCGEDTMEVRVCLAPSKDNVGVPSSTVAAIG